MASDTLLTLRMTENTAMKFGLLVCECGHPKNNHFDFDHFCCAHCKECNGYKQIGRNGIEILKSK